MSDGHCKLMVRPEMAAHGFILLPLKEAVSQGMISKIVGYQRIPLGDTLEALLAYTGLPTDAFIRPERFLAEHPNFLHQTPSDR